MNDRQPLISHLRELRDRLIKAVIVLAITTGLSFFFTDALFRILLRPAGDLDLVYTAVTEFLSTYFKVALLGGLVLSLPFIVLQIVLFIRPALLPSEKRYLYIALPGVTLSYMAGVAFGYFVLLPPALGFLFSFGADIARPMISIGNYISVVTTLLLWLGLVFEMPFVLFILTRLGIVTPKGLAKKRRWAFVLAFVLGAFITPTPDPLNQTIVALPIMALYEVGTQLSKLAYHQRTRAQKKASGGAQTAGDPSPGE